MSSAALAPCTPFSGEMPRSEWEEFVPTAVTRVARSEDRLTATYTVDGQSKRKQQRFTTSLTELRALGEKVVADGVLTTARARARARSARALRCRMTARAPPEPSAVEGAAIPDGDDDDDEPIPPLLAELVETFGTPGHGKGQWDGIFGWLKRIMRDTALAALSDGDRILTTSRVLQTPYDIYEQMRAMYDDETDQGKEWTKKQRVLLL